MAVRYTPPMSGPNDIYDLSPPVPEDFQEVSELVSPFANPVRAYIIWMILRGRSTNDILEPLDMTRQGLQSHLVKLKSQGVIESKKGGGYSLTPFGIQVALHLRQEVRQGKSRQTNLLTQQAEESKALENETRKEFYDMVVENPGRTISDIADQGDWNHSTVKLHIKILNEFGLITTRKKGDSMHLFPLEPGPGTKESLLDELLEKPGVRDAIEYIYNVPWTTPDDVADEREMDISDVEDILADLEAENIVDVLEVEGSRYFYINPDIEHAVEEGLERQMFRDQVALTRSA